MTPEDIFPVLQPRTRKEPRYEGPPVPWAMLQSQARQAWLNHGQSLEQLADRGGLCPSEILAVVEGRRWHPLNDHEANAWLTKRVQEWHAAQAVPKHVEPHVTINGITLTAGEAMTLRTALTSFVSDMQKRYALGSDEHGETMRKNYLKLAEKIQDMCVRKDGKS